MTLPLFRYIELNSMVDLEKVKKYLDKKGMNYHQNISPERKEIHYFFDKSAVIIEEMKDTTKIKIFSDCSFNSMDAKRNLERAIEKS